MTDICEQTRLLGSAYLDNELGASESLTVEKHLRECAACSDEIAALTELSQQIKRQARYHAAPPALHERVRASVAGAPKMKPVPTNSRIGKKWLRLAGAIAAAILLTTGVNWYWNLKQAETRLRHEIVSSHIRSLLSQSPFDIASSDRHTVKPWFNGKVDVAPPVLDLASQGFPLLGGRLDYVNQRTVAVVAYGRRKHVINLYVQPDAKTTDGPPQPTQAAGYNLVEWQANGMRLVAVSDLAVAELLEFARLFPDR